MNKQVLVAGGGIGGLAAALGASRAGWDVRLYERAAAFSEVGAGVQIGPNVVRRLQAWGLLQPLQGVAAFPSRLQVRNAVSGKELAVLPLGPTAVELVDRTMIELSLANPAFRPTIETALIGRPEAILLVEFSGDDKAVLTRQLRDR